MVKSRNAVVQRAVNAWYGNPYKCPYCGSTNGWTYDGHCKSKRCRRKLPVQKYAERINEVVKRKIVRSNNPQDLKNIAEITGVPVDILRGRLGREKMMKHGQGALKLRQKHSDLQGKGKSVEKFRRKDTQGIGFTLAKGRVGPTTKGSKIENPIDPNRDAIIHKGSVAYLDKSRKGRYTLTTHYKSGEDVAKEERIRKKR